MPHTKKGRGGGLVAVREIVGTFPSILQRSVFRNTGVVIGTKHRKNLGGEGIASGMGSPARHEAPTGLTASAVEPADRPHPHRIPLKPDLLGERVRAETDYFRGDSARMSSRTGSVVGSRPDFDQPYAVAETRQPPPHLQARPGYDCSVVPR
jgi:hypothetical protein